MVQYWKHKDNKSYIILGKDGNSYIDKEANNLMCRLQETLRAKKIDTVIHYNDALRIYLVKSPLWECVTDCIYKNDPTINQ